MTLRRANALSALLSAAGWQPLKPPPVVRPTDAPAEVRNRLQATYDLLGGLPDAATRIRPGSYDLAYQHPIRGLVVVELDEEQHFTRWRAQTLAQPWAAEYSWTQAYLDYCETVPHYRLHGGYWTSPSAERMFGPGDPPGDFTNVGSPRGRQRALYDAAKDLLPGPPLARVSVHDTVGATTLQRVLKADTQSHAEAVASLVESRLRDRLS